MRFYEEENNKLLQHLIHEVKQLTTATDALVKAVADLTDAVKKNADATVAETATINTSIAGINEALTELKASSDPAVAAAAQSIEDQVAALTTSTQAIADSNTALATAAAGLPVAPTV